MKIEHRSIIDRARSMGLYPSELAHELLVHDLVAACLGELRNLKAAYSSLNESTQQEVIDRLTDAARGAATVAIRTISTRDVEHVQVEMKSIKVEAKTLTITAKVDAHEPSKHALTDSAGKLCLLVIAPNDYEEAMDDIVPDRDQKNLALPASEILGGLDLRGSEDIPEGDDPLYQDVVQVITETRRATISAVQRKFTIGYNRAARLIDRMEQEGLVTAPNSNGVRDVLIPPPAGHEPEPEPLHTPEEQADDLYGRALAIVREDGGGSVSWLQMRLAVGQEQAEALITRLREAGEVGEPDEKGNHPLLVAPIPDVAVTLEQAPPAETDSEPDDQPEVPITLE
ncbi:DNA translocase FtsK [Pseudomonas tohonis]|uniref:DNA translocase FtsK n=1 Tax=Pseudomonas tohonis TaxID=2725477 RepID=UPI0021D9CC9A|nr:DNA translocase FtsK [Pseudomonas tohonis]UXY55357.1 DNA translocase FtsK [Pseudomonas tohonis]